MTRCREPFCRLCGYALLHHMRGSQGRQRSAAAVAAADGVHPEGKRVLLLALAPAARALHVVPLTLWPFTGRSTL